VLPLLRAGQVALAGMVLARMESVPAEERPRDGEARLHAARALRAGFEGDPWRFREDSEAAARGYRRLDEARLAMIHETNAAFGATQLGQGEHASALLRAVRDEATGLGLLRAVAVATHNLGPARLLCGDVEGALAAERDAVVMADVLGDPRAGRHVAGLPRAHHALGGGPPRVPAPRRRGPDGHGREPGRSGVRVGDAGARAPHAGRPPSAPRKDPSPRR
jgi:hypothetical protein